MKKGEILLVIDMQERFLLDKKPDDLAQKIAVQQAMIAHFLAQDLPIIYTIFDRLKFGNIDDRLQPPSQSTTIVKTDSDAFVGTNLRSHVEGHRLHVAGCNAEVCVRLTIDSALRLGYSVVLYKNAVLAGDSSMKKMAEVLFRYFLTPGVKVREF